MLKELIKVAHELDKLGLLSESNLIDKMIKILASSECKYEKEFNKIISVFTKAFLDSNIRVIEEDSFCSGDEISIGFKMSHDINIGEVDKVRCLQTVKIRVDGPMKDDDNILYSVSSRLKAYGTRYGDSFFVEKEDTTTEKEYRFQRGQVAYDMKDKVIKMIGESSDELRGFVLEQEEIING